MNDKRIFTRPTLGAWLAALALGVSGAGFAQTTDQSAPQGDSAQQQSQMGEGASSGATEAPSSDSASSGAAPFITQQESSQTLASSIMGMSIHNGPGEEAKEIGKVTDLILDENQKLAGVVVGVGGFLGIGQKDVGIPWDKVDDIDPKTDIAIVHMTKEELEAAPSFTTTEEQEKKAEQEQAAMSAQQGASGGGGMGAAPAAPPPPASK